MRDIFRLLKTTTWKTEPDRNFDITSKFIELIFIAGLITYSCGLLSRSLSIPWYYHADEIVYTSEIIKFLELNFNQNFFDIPGTPFMLLSAFLWALWYWALHLLGFVNDDLGIKLFTFEHISQLYSLMRFLVLVFYATSIFLVYAVGKRLTNSVGGCVAAVLLAFSTPYASYNTFVRTESLGISLMLLALWLVLDAVEHERLSLFLAAGFLAGIATAARFHFALATLPVILPLILIVRYRKHGSNKGQSDQNSKLFQAVVIVLGGACIVGSVIVLLLQQGAIERNFLTDAMLISPDDPTLAKSLALMRKLWLLLGAISAALFTAFYIPRLRPWLQWLIRPAIVFILFGFGCGLIAGTPTFLWRGSYLLRSIQFYADWTDYDRARLPRILQFLDLYSDYWSITVPNLLTSVLLITGILLIIYRQDLLFYPILIGVLMLFISQPILLPVFPHRVIPWLSYSCIVEAYPLAITYQILKNKIRSTQISSESRRLILISIILLLFVNSSFFISKDGVKQTADKITSVTIPRLSSVSELSQWLENNTSSKSEIFLSYSSFNEPLFYTWMELQGVEIPASFKRSRKYYPWWGDRTSLQNRSGYVVASKQDIDMFKSDWDNKKAGEGVDPFNETRFKHLVKFKGGEFSFVIFKFE